MRANIKADTRLPWEKLFFKGDFSHPLTREGAKELCPDYEDALEFVRLAPSAVNKQPWRIVCDGKAFHFYEARTLSPDSHNGFDIQRVDMGIALNHFHLAAKEKNLSGHFEKRDLGAKSYAGAKDNENNATNAAPQTGINIPDSTDYIVSWVAD